MKTLEDLKLHNTLKNIIVEELLPGELDFDTWVKFTVWREDAKRVWIPPMEENHASK